MSAVASTPRRDYVRRVFGVSPVELMFVGIVALLVVGPDKLPAMLRSVGSGLSRLRRLTLDVRNQSGIDEILQAEGLSGGLDELRSLMRRGSAPMSAVARSLANAAQTTPARVRAGVRAAAASPTVDLTDRSREYPIEGADAAGALPEDLLASARPAGGDSEAHAASHPADTGQSPSPTDDGAPDSEGP